jgi:hypothetical protein
MRSNAVLTAFSARILFGDRVRYGRAEWSRVAASVFKPLWQRGLRQRAARGTGELPLPGPQIPLFLMDAWHFDSEFSDGGDDKERDAIHSVQSRKPVSKS